MVWLDSTGRVLGLDALLSDRVYPLSQLPQFAARLGLVCAGCGLVFGTVLAIAERRRTFVTLSSARMALWGASVVSRSRRSSLR